MSELKKIATGGFNDLQGRLWTIDIYNRHQVGLGTRPLTFDADEPAVVEWDELDLESPIQGSALTLRIISEADREWLPLYTMLDGEVVAEVLLEGELWWRGSLDPESYEEPYEAADGYTVELRFTDFAPLKRARFRPADSASGFFRLGVSLGANLLAVGATRGLDENGLPENIDISRAHHMGDRQDRLMTGCQRGAFLDEDEDTTDYIPAWDALTALLQAANLRMIQRAGSIRLFRLTNLATQTAGSAVEVEWTGDRQTLSMAPVASRVSVKHEGDGEENLLPEFKTGRGKDGDPTASHAFAATFGATEYSYLSSFTINEYATSSWGGPENIDGLYTKEHPCFKIKGTIDTEGDSEGRVMGYLHSPYDKSEITKGVIPTNLEHSIGEIGAPEVYIHLTGSRGRGTSCAEPYRLHILQEMLFDARYNPFSGREDDNYFKEHQEMLRQCAYVMIPCKLTLRTEEGNTFWWTNKNKVSRYDSSTAVGSAPTDYDGCGWSDEEAIYWLQYRPKKEFGNDATGVGGWTSNQQASTVYGKKGFKYSEGAVSLPDGDLIPLPPEKGWLRLQICGGICTVKFGQGQDGHYNRSTSAVIPSLRWLLFKPAEISIASTLKGFAEVESASTEVKVICNNGAEDEVEVTPLLGSAGGFNGCRTVAMDANGDVIQGGGIERDIATDIASQMADRRLVLSGESALETGDSITFTERNQPGRVFLMQSERMDLIRGWGDRSIVEFLPVTVKGLEVRVNEKVVAEADPDRGQGGLSPTVYSIQPTATSVATVPMGADGGDLVWRYIPESVGCSVFATSGADTLRTRDGTLRIRMTDHAGTDTMDEAVETDGGELRPLAIPRGCASVEFRLMSSSDEDAEQLAIVTIPVAAVYDSSRDRGQWTAGEDYYAGDFNPDYGAFETSHVWYMGCKYRCLVTGTSDPPLWNSPDWQMEEGDTTFRAAFAESEQLFDPDSFSHTLTVRATLYNQDVTAALDSIEWSRYSEDADGVPRTLSDQAWTAAHDRDGPRLTLTAEDCGFLGYIPRRLLFRAKVTLRVPGHQPFSEELTFGY